MIHTPSTALNQPCTQACETLALDLRGYGTPLLAPEVTSPRDNSNYSELPAALVSGRSSAVAAAAEKSRLPIGARGRGRGRDDARTRRPWFKAETARSLQDERAAVASDQVCAWEHFS